MAVSYRQFTGTDLMAGLTEPASWAPSLYHAPFVLVSHGTEPDPVLCYGNARALDLWEMNWEEFTSTPSRFTAEAPNREERARLLAEVSTHGFIRNYSGVRISKNGRRFRIQEAIVWNIFSENQEPCGQAACFKDWEFL
jgi:hypothetical protein